MSDCTICNNTCVGSNMNTELNYGQMFFMMWGMLPFCTIVPLWLISKFIYIPLVLRSDKELEEYLEELRRTQPYEEKYQIEEQTDDDPTETNINNVVIDATPDGNVAMRFCKNEDGFLYWADNNISYKYLETVARKYVRSFNCRGVYIDRVAFLKKKLDKLQEEINKNNEAKNKADDNKADENNANDNKADDNVFANLKKYNSKSKNVKLKTKIMRSDVVCDKANKYVRRGKFKDSNDWLSSRNDNGVIEETDTGVLGWLMWKKKQQTATKSKESKTD